MVVVAGHHLKDFVRSLPADQPREALDEVWRNVDDHARKRDQREAERLAVPLSVTDFLICIAVFVGALIVGLLSVTMLHSVTHSSLLAATVGCVASCGLFIVNRRWERVRIPALGAFAGAVPMTLLISVAALASLV